MTGIRQRRRGGWTCLQCSIGASAWSDDGAAALAEADAGEALAPAARPHDDGVAVLEKAAGLAGGKLDRTAAAGGNFEQAAERVIGRTGNRAGAEDVGWPQVAAVAAVVGD